MNKVQIFAAISKFLVHFCFSFLLFFAHFFHNLVLILLVNLDSVKNAFFLIFQWEKCTTVCSELAAITTSRIWFIFPIEQIESVFHRVQKNAVSYGSYRHSLLAFSCFFMIFWTLWKTGFLIFLSREMNTGVCLELFNCTTSVKR